MSAARSEPWAKPPGSETTSLCPGGGSPPTANTFSIPPSTNRWRTACSSARLLPAQVTWATGVISSSRWMRSTSSSVRDLVLPPAPQVTETKPGSSSRSAAMVAKSAATPSSSLGGKNSKLKSGRCASRRSATRMVSPWCQRGVRLWGRGRSGRTGDRQAVPPGRVGQPFVVGHERREARPEGEGGGEVEGVQRAQLGGAEDPRLVTQRGIGGDEADPVQQGTDQRHAGWGEAGARRRPQCLGAQQQRRHPPGARGQEAQGRAGPRGSGTSSGKAAERRRKRKSASAGTEHNARTEGSSPPGGEPRRRA